MQRSLKIIDLAVSISVFAAVISFLMFLMSFGYKKFTELNNAMLSKVNMDASTEWQQYDNSVIKGDVVRNLIDRYSDDVFIRVATVNQQYGFYGNVDTVSPESPYFVDMTSDFLVSVVYNDNGQMVGLSIVQIPVLDAVLNSAVYCNVLERELQVYDTVIGSIEQTTNNLRIVNGSNRFDFVQEAIVACRKYYLAVAQTEVCQRILGAL